jgi:hypothetical protein
MGNRFPLSELEKHLPEKQKQQPAQQEKETRKRALFYLNPAIFLWMARGKFEVVDNSLPPDVQLVGANFDHQRNLFVVCVESSEFKGVPEGEVLPEIAAPHIRRLEE